MQKKVIILSTFFILFIVSNIFAVQDENRVRFILNLKHDLMQELASASESKKIDNVFIDKIIDINSDRLKELDITVSGSNIVFDAKFSLYDIKSGDQYMIKRAFILPYALKFKINKYFIYKLIGDNYKETIQDDLKNISSFNTKQFVNIEKSKDNYKVIIDVTFNIDVQKMTGGHTKGIIIETQATPLKEISSQAELPLNSISSSDQLGIEAFKAIEKAKALSYQKDNEREEIKKQEEENHRLELERKEKEQNEKTKMEEQKRKEEEERKAIELDEQRKKEEEERLNQELEEVSQRVDKKEKKEIVSTEDYLKQMLYKRRKKELEERNIKRQELVKEKENINLNSIILYSLDNKSYSFNEYSKITKGIIVFAWTTPEGVKSNTTYLNEMVYFQMHYGEYQKKGIDFLSIYIPHEDQNLSDEELENIKRIVKRYKISYPVLIDYGLIFYDQLRLKALPITLILNQSLKVVDVYYSFSKSNQNALESKIMSLLGQEGAEDEKLKEEIFIISEKAFAYYKYASLLFKLGDLKSSEDSVIKSLYITRQFPYPFNLMGIIYTEKKEFAKAYEYFNQAIKLDSTQAEFYSNMGYAKLENNEINDALIYFQKALQKNPALIQAHYGQALIWKNTKQLNKALSEINFTLELCEKKAEIKDVNINRDVWEKLNWFNQQKCIHYERFLILSGDLYKIKDAAVYLKEKLVKDKNCTACHIQDALKINYIAKTEDLENYLKNPDNKNILSEIRNNEFIHRPVADNNCIVCHTFNNNKNAFQPIVSSGELCSECHKSLTENSSREHVHVPVKDGKCIECHYPHGGPYSSFLKFKLEDLCYKCHKESDSNERNHVLFKKGECVYCHVSHNSFNPVLLEDNLADICFNCHQPERDIFYKDIQHGPIKEGTCIPCHKLHNNKSTYKIEDICFDCHFKNGIYEPTTITLTGFRNGEFNLHEKHVNRMLQGKPIMCESCHDFHASEQKSLLRKGTKHNPRWGFTINYEKNETGGKCIVGCHKPREYNRVKPIDALIWK